MKPVMLDHLKTLNLADRLDLWREAVRTDGAGAEKS
jgi:hypothetical protein